MTYRHREPPAGGVAIQARGTDRLAWIAAGLAMTSAAESIFSSPGITIVLGNDYIVSSLHLKRAESYLPTGWTIWML